MPTINPNLTWRELDVLKLLKTGAANKEIGDRLGITHHTVHMHTLNVYRKLGVHTRTAAVVEGLRRGLV